MSESQANSTQFKIKLSVLQKIWTLLAVALLLLSLIAPALFLFSIPLAVWNVLVSFFASKYFVQVVGSELHYKRGRKLRVIQLSKLVKLSSDLGRDGSSGQRNGVGTLTVVNEAGDSLVIHRVANCVALVEAIKKVSGPVLEPKKDESAKVEVAAAPATLPLTPNWTNTAASTSPASQEQFEVILPGYSGRSTDFAGLMLLVTSGVLRPNINVKEVRTGNVFMAKQVPGLYSSKEYVTALVLSVLVGSLGVDRFYLGYTGLGIAKLLTFGGFGVWTIVDLILIAMRKVPDINGAPLS
jgi:TM2 domain